MPDAGHWRGTWPSPEDLRDQVRKVLSLDLDPERARRLLEFLGLLERWAAKFNLIAAISRKEVVERHLLDSLAPASLIADGSSIADFGSGAGFPGVPLAVLRPGSTVHLVESRSHRANFLRQAVRSLRLANAKVFAGRGEDFPAGSAAVVIARAVRFEETAAFARVALSPGGRLIQMIRLPEALADRLGYAVLRRVDYRLPGDRRHALIELAPS